MRLLLDTHAFIWWVNGDRRLSDRVIAAIDAPETDLWLSAVSVWEMAVKMAKARLPAGDALMDKAGELLGDGLVQELPVRARHAAIARTLPIRHSDPFDRLLICQAMAEQMRLVTRDRMIGAYDVPVFW